MIYLDNNATTIIDPRVIKAMYQHPDEPKNPSSIHFFGQKAKAALQEARRKIAEVLGVKPLEIIFSSGGTESLNMVIRGALKEKTRIISTEIEHSAVYETLLMLKEEGHDVHFLETGQKGFITPEELESALDEKTHLIVLSAVNGETGVKIELEKIAAIAKEKNIPLIIDGVALLGRELFTIPEGVSAMCFSGHKLHAPKGTGFAFIRAGFSPKPLLHGGDQEYQKRAGTENFEGILGLAEAVSLLQKELPEKTHQMEDLRNFFEKELKKIGKVHINGEGERICNVSNLSFEGLDGETLLIMLDQKGIAASHGSACSSGALEPSRVLLKMGLSPKRARSSLRFSLSRFTTKEEIETVIRTLSKILGYM